MTEAGAAPSSPAALRNRGPILEVLRRRLPPDARVLEVACGLGEHAVWFAAGLPGVRWTPADADPYALAVAAARIAAEGPPNCAPPMPLDVTDDGAWPSGPFEAVYCANMIHIAPWAAAEGLARNASRVLTPGGRLILYGPFRETETPCAPSNEAFDASLKARDPAWGLRDREAVEALCAARDLVFEAREAMPANNLVLVFLRG